jgi:hypothetical protein
MSKPFEVGKMYKTQAGESVTIIETKNDLPGYECVRGCDHGTDNPHYPRYEGATGRWHTSGWRYNRESDRGRVTGSAFDMSDPRNLIPEE